MTVNTNPAQPVDGQRIDSAKSDTQPLAVASFAFKEFDSSAARVWKNEAHGILEPKSLQNVIATIATHPNLRGCIVLDDFNQKITVVKPLPWDDPAKFEARSITNDDIRFLQARLETPPYNLRPSKQMVIDGISAAASMARINPVRDYLLSLKWDGTPRIDGWLIKYCGATQQPAEYVAAVGSCFLKAAVKRVINPGIEFHHMLVLEGGQAAGKSSALKALATFGKDKPISYFTDRIGFEDIGSKNIAEFLIGNLIIEFQELTGLNKKDRNKVKQWITQTHDEVQKKWENQTTIYPRQFVLAGTTNEKEWLNDPTGGRRFWPVGVSNHIDVAGILEVNEQLWAEATHRVASGELWYILPDNPVYNLAQEEQGKRFVSDAWEDLIEEHVSGRDTIRIDDIFRDVLNIPAERWDGRARSRVAGILTNLGFKQSFTTKNSKRIRVWKIEKAQPVFEEIVF
jgi:predicted P-loop ATPase